MNNIKVTIGSEVIAVANDVVTIAVTCEGRIAGIFAVSVDDLENAMNDKEV
jgi:hypothetical protein